MTILGAKIRPDHALIWTDTTIFRDGRPDREIPKLALNPMGLAAAGTGMSSLIEAGRHAVQSAMDFDGIEDLVPTVLRSKAAQIASEAVCRDPFWFCGQAFAVVGYSSSAERMLGWCFDACGFFEPTLMGSIVRPGGDSIEAMLAGVLTQDDIVRIARRQMAALREGGGESGGGTLTIAQITPTSVHCWKIVGFDGHSLRSDADEPVDGLAALREVISHATIR